MVGNVLANTSHKKVGQPSSSVGRDANKICINFIIIIENALFNRIIVENLYGQIYIGLLQKGIDLALGISGAQELITWSIDVHHM